jgi:hypothetical protein
MILIASIPWGGSGSLFDPLPELSTPVRGNSFNAIPIWKLLDCLCFAALPAGHPDFAA